MTTPALNWQDPDAVRVWLKDIDTYVQDLVAIAEDQIDAPARRVHGREGARRLIKDAKRSLRDWITFARRGLPDKGSTP
jgi:hypothetical protein